MLFEQQRIQETLKKLMKEKKMTHQSLAKKLKISPATVKRRLNGDDLSLRQLKEFSEGLSLSLYEVIELSKQSHREPHLFTEAQERLLASELWIMNLFRMIVAGQEFSEIKKLLDISEKDLRRATRELEKTGLAQLLPGDRFVPMVHFPFKWISNGPLSKTYDKLTFRNLLGQMENDLGSAGLNQQFELVLSPEIYKNFCEDIRACYEKYRGLSELHLSSRIDLSNLVSGVFFIDKFSIWNNYSKK